MKIRIFIPIAVVLTCIIVFAQEEEKKREGVAYYPLEPGLSWTYRSGSAQALVNISRKETLDGKECFVAETVSGAKLVQKQWLYVTDEGIFVVKDIQLGEELNYDPPLQVAKFPFKEGTKWKWVGKVRGKTISKVCEVKGTKTVSVPAGTFTGLKLDTLVNPGGIVLKVSEVYAPGVGLVWQERDVIGKKKKELLKLVEYSGMKEEEKQDDDGEDEGEK